MEIFERVRELRKNQLKLSQEHFGEKLGVSRSVIKNMELGVLARPEQKEPIIKLICKTFNVSYDWLTTGEGEMFNETIDEYVERFTDSANISPNIKAFMKIYFSVDDERRDILDGVLQSLSAMWNAAPDDAASVSVEKAIDNTRQLYRAARSEGNTEHEIIPDTDGKIERFKTLPKVTDKKDL